MSKKIKVCLYWITVILPVFDIIKGAITGIKNVFEEVRLENMEKAAEERLYEMKERFEDDNR